MDHPAGCLSAASFGTPEWFPYSAWVGHAPFAFWLVEAHRPAAIVELGCYSGYSYMAFCQEVRRLGLDARCAAVDTWKGDEHTGFYGEKLFDRLRSHHDPRYGRFSTLIRSTFDEAAGGFADGSIDLLHVDGRHFYDDVKHDFETWRPKLSPRAVVLFHDTQVRDRNFGVGRFWTELCSQHPHFEFTHSEGLGVLAFGSDPSVRALPIFAAASDPDATQAVRAAYARLGDGLSHQMHLKELSPFTVELKWLRRVHRWRRGLRRAVTLGRRE